MNESRPSKAQEAFLKAEKRHHILGDFRGSGTDRCLYFQQSLQNLPLLLHHGHGQKYFSPYWDYVI